MNGRYYSPSIGAYTSRAPGIGQFGTYTYMQGNPTSEPKGGRLHILGQAMAFRRAKAIPGIITANQLRM